MCHLEHTNIPNRIQCLKKQRFSRVYISRRLVPAGWKQPTMGLDMERVKEEEVEMVMELVNKAYHLEKGFQGFAFKTKDR